VAARVHVRRRHDARARQAVRRRERHTSTVGAAGAAVAVAAGRSILFGNIEGGAQALAYAALHPERVPGAILFGTGVQSGAQAPGIDPLSPEVEGFLEALRSRWGRSDALDAAGSGTPQSASAGALEALAHFQRMVISPGGMIAMTRSILRTHVGWLEPFV
jgi:pimeloyl-ACP methyl ester carboxylesterase